MADKSDPTRQPTMIRLRPDIRAAADKAAFDDHRSLSSLIEFILAGYLKKTGYLR
ncbi:MAG TPA: hypothetical protein VE986_01430 [Hyphomicrobiales bacterium]|nr:hypothetical protein [Hyphomicrobiales bacterium]